MLIHFLALPGWCPPSNGYRNIIGLGAAAPRGVIGFTHHRASRDPSSRPDRAATARCGHADHRMTDRRCLPCTEVLDELPTLDLLRAAIEGLVAALKASQTKIQTLKTQMARKLTTLQAQVQPTTPPEVRA